jgi:hypothetical protein
MGLNIGGIIGGIVGSMLGIPGGAALGAGLGAKATGASDKEAMMYGLGGLMLGGAGGAAGKAGGLFGKTGMVMGGFLGQRQDWQCFANGLFGFWCNGRNESSLTRRPFCVR